MTNRTRTAAAGITLLCAAATATAGDCTPTWDPAFGVPGIDSGIAFDLTTHDGQLYTSGTFNSIGGTAAARIAGWDGSSWNALGSGLSGGEGYAMASFNGSLYSAGYFNTAGGVAGTAKIARWDGTAWNSLNAQLELFSNQLWDLTTWDDGTGEALYVVGNYQNAGGVSGASYISKWDGLSFAPVGTPIGGAVPLIIFTAETWDDGTGEALYVGGRFLTIDGVPASRIAKYDGTEWTALGGGLTGPGATPSVMAMAAFDDGTGEALYVAGQTFNSADGTPVNRIARWDGTNWSAVGEGFANGIIWDLEVFDDGSGPALYATGTFTASGSTPLRGLAKWDGTSWSDAGNTDADTYSAIVFDDGSGPGLYVSGRYTEIGGVTASGIARLSSCVTGDLPGDVNGDGSVNTTDLLLVLSAWGPCEKGAPCPADLNDTGGVEVQDLLLVLANWS